MHGLKDSSSVMLVPGRFTLFSKVFGVIGRKERGRVHRGGSRTVKGEGGYPSAGRGAQLA